MGTRTRTDRAAIVCLRRVGSRFLPACTPSHPFSILEQQKSVSCLQVRRIELSIVASPLIAQCVEPSIGALSGQGGLYDVPPSGSSQPTSTPSLQNRLQEPSAGLVAVDTTYMQCGINKGPTRPAYSDVMIVPGTACFPVSSSREANWEFQVPTSSIITNQPGIQAFPWTHTSQAAA